MDWAAAHKINNNAFKIGAGWEAKVVQMFIVLSKIKNLVLLILLYSCPSFSKS